ncbi:MAG: phosphatidylglycerol---prolipoprotein diacylglyceryl transferase [Acidobacteriota bacterium]|jgi:prolipoprotein diacylglyceryltransferase
MTFPVYLHIGGLTIHPHWIFESLGYAVGLYWSYRSRRRIGDVVDPRSRRAVTIAALVGGLIGSRLSAAFEEPLRLSSGGAGLEFLFSGKTIVGGLVGGIIAVELVKWLRGVTTATGDLFTLPLILGIAIGRIGCFLSRLDDQSYGIATSLPWGVDLGDGIRRHPTQLYEIAFLAALVATLLSLWERLRVTGDRFKLFIVSYLGFRLLVDFLKPGVRLGGLTTIQWICIAAIAFYAPHVMRLASEVRSE